MPAPRKGERSEQPIRVVATKLPTLVEVLPECPQRGRWHGGEDGPRGRRAPDPRRTPLRARAPRTASGARSRWTIRLWIDRASGSSISSMQIKAMDRPWRATTLSARWA